MKKTKKTLIGITATALFTLAAIIAMPTESRGGNPLKKALDRNVQLAVNYLNENGVGGTDLEAFLESPTCYDRCRSSDDTQDYYTWQCSGNFDFKGLELRTCGIAIGCIGEAEGKTCFLTKGAYMSQKLFTGNKVCWAD